MEYGNVAEVEMIPLQSYKEITLKKWRKATTAESIITYGFDQAVNMTIKEMLRDVQHIIEETHSDLLYNYSIILFFCAIFTPIFRTYVSTL